MLYSREGLNSIDEQFRIVSDTDKCIAIITPEFGSNYWITQAALKYFLAKKNQHKVIPILLNTDESLTELDIIVMKRMKGTHEEERENNNTRSLEIPEKILRRRFDDGDNHTAYSGSGLSFGGATASEPLFPIQYHSSTSTTRDGDNHTASSGSGLSFGGATASEPLFPIQYHSSTSTTRDGDNHTASSGAGFSFGGAKASEPLFTIQYHSSTSTTREILPIGESIVVGSKVCGSIGPFVRINETGELGFVTARHLFPEGNILGEKVFHLKNMQSAQTKHVECGEVIAYDEETHSALVRIFKQFIPTCSSLMDVNIEDLSRAGLKYPFRIHGAVNIRTKPLGHRSLALIFTPHGELFTGHLSSVNKEVIFDDMKFPGCFLINPYSNSKEIQPGSSGKTVFLVEDENCLSYIGIVIGSQEDLIVCKPIQDILQNLEHASGQSLMLETFMVNQDAESFLDPYNSYIFNEALKQGSSEDRYVRINVVGNYDQGKTSLTRRLMNQSLEGITSTDGIDVHVRKCKIKESEWENSETELDTNDCLIRLAKEINRLKQKTEVKGEPESKDIGGTETQLKPFDSSLDIRNEESVTSVPDMIPKPQLKSDSGSSETVDKKLIPETESFLKIYSSHLKDKLDEHLGDNTLIANIWDFGGQYIYYATHQIFHSRDAIYLLVFDMTKDFDEFIKDKEFPERTKTMKHSLKFWVDSIHAYARSEDDSSDTATKAKPTVILVGTHKDEFIGDIEKIFHDVLDIFVDDEKARKHISTEHFAVSNTDISNTEFMKLKSKIFEVGMEQSKAKSVPLKWIPLEMALLEEKSKNIISLEDVRNLNSKNDNLVKEKEMKTVLKYLHLKGALVFFDEVGLESHVVVNPQYLVDAFRCIIGARSCIDDAELHPLWKQMNDTSILEKKLLIEIWKKEVEKNFLGNEKALLMFLQRHRVLARLNVMNEDGQVENQDRYMIPSLLKYRFEESEMKSFIGRKSTCEVSLRLQMKSSALLPHLFEKIVAGVLGKWSPVQIKKQKQTLVFQNVGFFHLDRNHVGAVELKTGMGIQITVINQCPEIKVCREVCDLFRRYIESLVKPAFQKYSKNTHNHPYTYSLSCNNSEHGGIGSETAYSIEEVRQEIRLCCPDNEDHSFDCKTAIEEWFLPGKITDIYPISRRRVTEKDLGRIAQCIGFNWEILGAGLGLSNPTMDRLKLDYPGQTATCIYKMLCTWKNSKKEDATLLELITCIEDNKVVSVDHDMLKNIIEEN